jgi:diguanylate cyclase (GGDEF)-like protein
MTVSATGRLQTPVRVLLIAAIACQVLYTLTLLLPVGTEKLVVDAVTSMVAEWTAVAACWTAVGCSAVRRTSAAVASAAVTATVLGDTAYLVTTDSTGQAPFPSPADLFYLAFYVLMLVTIALAARDHLRRRGAVVLFDVIVGSLGAASVLALLLTPVLDAAAAGDDVAGSLLSLAYPVLDVLLIASLLGVRASDRSGAPWLALVAGLLLFTGADVVFALQVPGAGYEVGTVLDAAWSVGVLLIVVWVCQSTVAAEPEGARLLPTRLGTGVAVLAILGAVTVLTVATIISASMVAVVLAVLTLVCTIAPVAIRRRHLRDWRDRDPLTGLINRVAVEQQVDAVVGAEGTGVDAALFVVELDDTRDIERGLGHGATDRVLVLVADALRRAAPRGASIGRLNGSGFVVFATGLDSREHERAAAALGEEIAAPLSVDGTDIVLSSTVGVAVAPQHGVTFAALLEHAEATVQKARVGSQASAGAAAADRPAIARERLSSLRELRSSRGREQIVLRYQPKIRISTGDIEGVEALVRWMHPSRGLLGPDQFIGLLDEAGLMTSWTRDILVTALDQAAEWDRRGIRLAVAVNVPGGTLAESVFIDEILPLLRERGLAPSMLTLEITEQQLLEDSGRVGAALAPLRDAGIRISFDDFGTGFNSLASLHEIVVDELKLDRSFVSPIAGDLRARALVKSVVALAADLGIETVAEGVQTPEVLAMLTELGCTYAQGFLIAEPMTADDVTALMTSRDPHAD